MGTPATDTKPSALSAAIQRALDSTEPFTKERNEALAAVRWVLACEGGYAALGDTFPYKETVVARVEDAQVFDGRDSEETKAAWYGRALKLECTPTLL